MTNLQQLKCQFFDAVLEQVYSELYDVQCYSLDKIPLLKKLIFLETNGCFDNSCEIEDYLRKNRKKTYSCFEGDDCLTYEEIICDLKILEDPAPKECQQIEITDL